MLWELLELDTTAYADIDTLIAKGCVTTGRIHCLCNQATAMQQDWGVLGATIIAKGRANMESMTLAVSLNLTAMHACITHSSALAKQILVIDQCVSACI